MTKYLAAARIDENGNARGGAAGDQTGSEVCVHKYANYRNGGWSCVLRYSSKRYKVVRNRMIRAAVKLARYNWVGYDQGDRESLYNYLYSKNWDVAATYKSEIQQNAKMETDCSQFMGCIANVGVVGLGLKPAVEQVRKDVWTGNMVSQFQRLGFMMVMHGIDFKTGKGLEPGDILLNPEHHTAIYIGEQKTGDYYVVLT